MTRFSKNTKNLHSNINWNIEKNEIPSPIHSAIQPSLAFHYENAEHLIEAFQNKRKSYTYSRQSSPTIAAFENKLNQRLGGKSSMVFSTGMAAISDTLIAYLKKGDHLITSKYLFGNTLNFFNTLERLGIEVSLVDTCSVDHVTAAVRPNTKVFFTETVSNPLTLIPDLKNIGDLLAEKNILSIIDSTITPLFQPQNFSFSLNLLSLSKYVAGHSNALAGSITDLGHHDGITDTNIIDRYKELDPQNCLMLQIRKKGMRDQGSTLSPFGAFLVSQGLDTLELRLAQHQKNVEAVAKFLANHPKVEKVNHPSLPSHPQHKMSQQTFNQFGAGAILSFTLKSTSDDSSVKIKQAINLLNHFKLILKSTHLGDARTMSIPMAPTIFNDFGIEGRKDLGIDEGLIRLSLGIEDTNDILNDLEQGLNKI